MNKNPHKFVGRKKEIKRILTLLSEKQNIVLVGKFGIGKTSLMKHIALTSDGYQFLFVDFSQTAKKICDCLMKQIYPSKGFNKRKEILSYKDSRFLLVTNKLSTKSKYVIVFDNTTKITHQKLKFIEYLRRSGKFIFIVIAERFLKEDELRKLQTELYPSKTINISHLDIKSRQEYFSNSISNKERRLVVAKQSNGYPLLMKELLIKELDKKPFNKDQSSPGVLLSGA